MSNETIDATLNEIQDQQVDANAPEQAPEQAQHSPVLYKFTNAESSPNLDNILAMFYQGVYNNTIGIMEAYNIETEAEELILVGVELDENSKPICFPLCSVLRAEDVTKFLSPNGKGGYFDMLNQAESEAAREEMRPYAAAVVEDYAGPETAEER